MAVITMTRVSRTEKKQPKPTEGGKWRRLVTRLMERGREASEVTQDESEEGGEVERRRPRREGAARDNYREARSYVRGGADGRAPTGTRRGCTRRAGEAGDGAVSLAGCAW
jgi:hypothetical protein